MSEKTYKVMTSAGAGSLVVGVLLIVTGVACGIISIVNGARLLKNKSDIIF